jgi:O-antigen ligase
MSEKLVFGYGTSRHTGETPSPAEVLARNAPLRSSPAFPDEPAVKAERRDWAFVGLMTFTALLFFRPQDLVTPLRALHLAELSAIFALGSLVASRLSRGLPVTRLTLELAGVIALGAVILMTAPFSVWMGGAIGTFTGLYAKVVLIFLLMVNTLTTPKRIERFTWLIVLASGYIAGRAVFDYARGINLIENGRVQGAVGGMFKNPNDLALNMVAVLPLAALLALRPLPAIQRATAALCGGLMLGAVIATQSRSGTVGLAVMALVLTGYMIRRKPGLVAAAVFAGVLALPMLPDSYWERVASITNKDLDQTGSREARSVLLQESFAAFAAHPLTGVGAGQFKNYNPEGRQEAWRESHNVLLQVAAELGIFGISVFLFLIGRALYAPIQTRRLLRAAAPGRRPDDRADRVPPLARNEYDAISMHSAALTASIVGWLVCALFASVAYHWTFYYLLALAAAPREYLLARVRARRVARRAAAASPVAAFGISA